jgi:manganese efflux pump family protein
MLKLIALVIPLGLDTFAVAAALGMAGLPSSRRLRVSALFMSFEAGVPVIGLVVGSVLSDVVGKLADFLAIAVLIGLGAFMLLSREAEGEASGQLLARTSGLAILGLGLSISLDELAIGFVLGLVKAPLLLAILLIAAQAFVVSQLGFRIGSRVNDAFRETAERLAGAALLLLGIGLAVARLTGIQV